MSKGKKLIQNDIARLKRLIEGRKSDIVNYKKQKDSKENKALKVPVDYSTAIKNSETDISKAKKDITEYEADLKKLGK